MAVVRGYGVASLLCGRRQSVVTDATATSVSQCLMLRSVVALPAARIKEADMYTYRTAHHGKGQPLGAERGAVKHHGDGGGLARDSRRVGPRGWSGVRPPRVRAWCAIPTGSRCRSPCPHRTLVLTCMGLLHRRTASQLGQFGRPKAKIERCAPSFGQLRWRLPGSKQPETPAPERW